MLRLGGGWNLPVLVAPAISVHLLFKICSIYVKNICKGILKSARWKGLTAAELTDVLKAPTDLRSNLFGAELLSLHLPPHCF